MTHAGGSHGASKADGGPTTAGGRIRADQRVGEVARDYPGALDVMKELGINHCCGAQLTLGEAARMAGVAPDALLAALRRAAGEVEPPPGAGERSTEPAPAERPAALVALPEARVVQVDVREDIRRGQEPFARIMGEVRHLGPGQVLLLRAPFEPIPLYEVLGKRGLAHWTEQSAADDWSVWFYRASGSAVAAGGGAAARTEPVQVVDVRGLDPPQPMVRILEALDGLAPGARLEVLHERRPVFLYPQLDERGFAHETDEPEPGLVRIAIRRREARP